jgi:hypothetical protein
MTLSEQLEEQIQRWNDGERKLTATIVAPEVELSADLRSLLDPFYKYAEANSVRRLPARPATVACWVRFQAGLGVPMDQILAALAADSGDGGQAFHLKADNESGRLRTAFR